MPLVFFDRALLVAQIDTTSPASVDLSEPSIVFILACTGILENRSFWTEMSDAEWDEIEAMIANLLKEIL